MADPSRAEQFRFVQRSYDRHTGVATLGYAFERGEPLVETLHFPWAPWPESAARQAAFMRALGLLHLLAGVSYWKAALPGRIEVGDHAVDERLAAFLEHAWTEGLGEFAHVNGLDLAGRIRFPVTAPATEKDAPALPPAEPLELPSRALVAMGGGKDSLVSLEMLRAGGVEVQPATVGASALIGDTVRAAGLPLIRIRRELAPRLMDMNAAGAWNGHVPVTAINMAILSCAALLYGYRWVVFSNERSAEQPTLVDAAGREVNHQYSKSLDFERRFGAVLRDQVTPDFDVFSLLRPLGEAAVTRRFSRLRQYHGVFSSCNRNFHQGGSRLDGRWCGDCPKCRFTTLALAPWLTVDEVRAIVGVHLLDEPAQEAGFRALCALGADKPFECVGTAEESRALLASLVQRVGWRDASLVRRLGPEVAEYRDSLQGLLEPGGAHGIPEEILARVAL